MDSDGQYSDLCCPICYSYFSEKEHVPHMLKCGHTYCNQCLTSLINHGSEKCGECRTVIGYRSAKSIPVNYSVLRLIASIESNSVKPSEFKDIDNKISNMMTLLEKNKQMYEMRVLESTKKIAAVESEKKNLREIKQSLIKDSLEIEKSKSLNKTLSTINQTMDKMKKIDQRYLLIQNRTQKGYNLNVFQSILDNPSDYEIKKGDSFYASCFVSIGKIYMNHFCSSGGETVKLSIDYNQLIPFLAGAFVIIEYVGRSVILEFEMFMDNPRSKHFIKACLGEKGTSYVKAPVRDHSRPNQEGESVVVGCLDISEKTRTPHKKEMKTGGGAQRKGAREDKGIRQGFIEGLGIEDPKTRCFRIYLEDWPSRSSSSCFGRVVRGSSILKSIVKNKYKIEVTQCGLIFDPVS